MVYSQFPTIGYEHTYGGESTDRGYGLVVAENGDRIIAGRTESSGAGSSDVLIIRTDSEGTELWSQTFGGTEYDYAGEIVLNDDGGVTVAGVTSSFGAGGEDVWVIRVGADGTEIWSQTYGGTGTENMPQIKLNADGSYTVLANTNSFTGYNELWFFKITDAGVLVWEQTNADMNTARDFAINSEGYIILGQTISNIILTQVDETGATIWQQLISPSSYHSDVGIPWLYDIELLSDGNFLIGGRVYRYDLERGQKLVMKVDATGSVLWSRCLFNESESYVTSILETLNGYYVVLGNNGSYSAGRTKVSASLLSPEGVEYSYRTYGPFGTNYARAVVELQNNEFLLCGYKTPELDGDHDVWVFNLDFNSNTEIVAVEDIPEDQGGWVRLTWSSSQLDQLGLIGDYGVWEMDLNGEWVALGSVQATGDNEYSYIAHTFVDSVEGESYLSSFRISSHTIYPLVFSYSATETGYSVDNLVPGTPEGLLVSMLPGSLELSWESVTDLDLNYYNVYRSNEADFDPSEIEPLFTTTDPSVTDADLVENTTYYYVVSAIDFHGNESDYSSEVSATVVGIENSGLIPMEFVLNQNFPNPFNPETTISYQLPESAIVTISVYDISGRLVETIYSDTQAPGYYSVHWKPSSQSTGVYIARIEAGEYSQMIRMLFLK